MGIVKEKFFFDNKLGFFLDFIENFIILNFIYIVYLGYF